LRVELTGQPHDHIPKLRRAHNRTQRLACAVPNGRLRWVERPGLVRVRAC